MEKVRIAMLDRAMVSAIGALALCFTVGCGTESPTNMDAAMDATRANDGAADALADTSSMRDGGMDGTREGGAYAQYLPLFTSDNRARSCAFQKSCPLTKIADVGDCLTSSSGTWTSTPDYNPRDILLLECASVSADCASWLACVAKGHGSDYCATHDAQSCDGDVEVDCFTGQAYAFDCTVFGQRCLTNGTYGHCANTTCPSGQQSTCDGNTLVQCQNGLAENEDCASTVVNPVCYANASSAGCGTADLCDPSVTYPRCNGAVAESCDGTHVFRRDCAGLYRDGVCDLTNPSRCRPLETDCSRYTEDQCSGTNLVICVNGTFQQFDCTSIGATGCVDGGVGIGFECGP